MFDRDEHLLNVHGDPSVAGTVPTHKPGERTLAAQRAEESGERMIDDDLRQKGYV